MGLICYKYFFILYIFYFLCVLYFFEHEQCLSDTHILRNSFLKKCVFPKSQKKPEKNWDRAKLFFS